MKSVSLDRETILKRINGIQNDIGELEKLAEIPFTEFKDGVGFKLTQFHLHRALEGVFHISSHILSRIPGAAVSEYKEMARKMGETGIVSKEFAGKTLQNMAGYRNRIVHFYSEISPEEIYKLINEKLSDFDIFLNSIKKVLESPEKFGLK